ncbi:DNA repair protein RAD51 homolog 3-like isoform X2 [Macrobrachium rosenbergii]|uniref:DNA repair protein RAD51 homolog 3-like isoform X2 n=1 Tax=Macrobrachium rosenbergii TaxID=79674 RepID=UPI0034D60019
MLPGHFKMSSAQLLSSFGLCSRVVRKLLETDFMYDADVEDLTPTELSAASGLDVDDCAEVIRSVSDPLNVKPRTVLQLLDDEDKYIVTFCKGLDDILGGGLPVGAITEVIGPPGIGKTQLCLQVCIAAQLPTSISGVDGEVVYIDTEGSFSARRLKVAVHAIQHLKTVNLLDSDAVNFTAESVLSRVHYFRCHSLFEVMATIKYVPVLQGENQRIKLIIVDSIAIPVVQDYLDHRMHRQLQCHAAQELTGLAVAYDLAVLFVNHLTEDKGHGTTESYESRNYTSKQLLSNELEGNVTENSTGKSTEAWSHCFDIKIKFNWESGIRVARLIKSPHGSNLAAKFQVTAGGIRDLIEDEVPLTDDKTQSTSFTNAERQGSKKRKLENLT